MTLKAVATRLQKWGVPSVVFEDEGRYRPKNKGECAVKFMFDPAVPIWRGAVVYQPSHAWPGLQVADMLAVAFSREYVSAQRLRDSKRLLPFDHVCKRIREEVAEKKVFAFDP